MEAPKKAQRKSPRPRKARASKPRSPKKINVARQGEILLFRMNDQEASSYRYFENRGEPVPGNVIREGEKSGHKHEIKGDGQLNLFGDQMVVDVGPKGAELVHPEHGAIKLAQGRYKANIQREFDGNERKASD